MAYGHVVYVAYTPVTVLLVSLASNPTATVVRLAWEYIVRSSPISPSCLGHRPAWNPDPKKFAKFSQSLGVPITYHCVYPLWDWQDIPSYNARLEIQQHRKNRHCEEIYGLALKEEAERKQRAGSVKKAVDMRSPWKEEVQHVDWGIHWLCQLIRADLSTCSETIPSALTCRTVGDAGDPGSIISEVYCERIRWVVGIVCLYWDRPSWL